MTLYSLNLNIYLSISQRIKNGFVDWSSLGEVDVKEKGDLILFNYNGHCQVTNRWNEFERVSRGLVFNKKTGSILAKPFSKFFNYGEELPLNQAVIIEATEKLDGSMIVCFWNPIISDWDTVTRGSFDSEQAIWAKEKLKDYNLKPLDKNYTYIFEAIYPENRIVVNYGDVNELFLIGARNNHYPIDYYFSALEVIANDCGFPLPLHYNFENISDYLNIAEKLSSNEEGFVVRYNDNTRFKVKGSAYKVAHRVITGLNEKRVVEAMQAGVLDDLLAGIPDEFVRDVRAYQTKIQNELDVIRNLVNNAYDKIPPMLNRKNFALQAKSLISPELINFMFMKLDGKLTDDKYYKYYLESLKNKDENK